VTCPYAWLAGFLAYRVVVVLSLVLLSELNARPWGEGGTLSASKIPF